jgi:hypothetical protein
MCGFYVVVPGVYSGWVDRQTERENNRSVDIIVKVSTGKNNDAKYIPTNRRSLIIA